MTDKEYKEEYSELDFPRRMTKIRKIQAENNRQWLNAKGTHESEISLPNATPPKESVNEKAQVERNAQVADLQSASANLLYNELETIQPHGDVPSSFGPRMAMMVDSIQKIQDDLVEQIREAHGDAAASAFQQASPPAAVTASRILREAAVKKEAPFNPDAQLHESEKQAASAASSVDVNATSASFSGAYIPRAPKRAHFDEEILLGLANGTLTLNDLDLQNGVVKAPKPRKTFAFQPKQSVVTDPNLAYQMAQQQLEKMGALNLSGPTFYGQHVGNADEKEPPQMLEPPIPQNQYQGPLPGSYVPMGAASVSSTFDPTADTSSVAQSSVAASPAPMPGPVVASQFPRSRAASPTAASRAASPAAALRAKSPAIGAVKKSRAQERAEEARAQREIAKRIREEGARNKKKSSSVYSNVGPSAEDLEREERERDKLEKEIGRRGRTKSPRQYSSVNEPPVELTEAEKDELVRKTREKSPYRPSHGYSSKREDSDEERKKRASEPSEKKVQQKSPRQPTDDEDVVLSTELKPLGAADLFPPQTLALASVGPDGKYNKEGRQMLMVTRWANIFQEHWRDLFSQRQHVYEEFGGDNGAPVDLFTGDKLPQQNGRPYAWEQDPTTFYLPVPDHLKNKLHEYLGHLRARQLRGWIFSPPPEQLRPFTPLFERLHAMFPKLLTKTGKKVKKFERRIPRTGKSVSPERIQLRPMPVDEYGWAEGDVDNYMGDDDEDYGQGRRGGRRKIVSETEYRRPKHARKQPIDQKSTSVSKVDDSHALVPYQDPAIGPIDLKWTDIQQSLSSPSPAQSSSSPQQPPAFVPAALVTGMAPGAFNFGDGADWSRLGGLGRKGGRRPLPISANTVPSTQIGSTPIASLPSKRQATRAGQLLFTTNPNIQFKITDPDFELMAQVFRDRAPKIDYIFDAIDAAANQGMGWSKSLIDDFNDQQNGEVRDFISAYALSRGIDLEHPDAAIPMMRGGARRRPQQPDLSISDSKSTSQPAPQPKVDPKIQLPPQVISNPVLEPISKPTPSKTPEQTTPLSALKPRIDMSYQQRGRQFYKPPLEPVYGSEFGVIATIPMAEYGEIQNAVNSWQYSDSKLSQIIDDIRAITAKGYGPKLIKKINEIPIREREFMKQFARQQSRADVDNPAPFVGASESYRGTGYRTGRSKKMGNLNPDMVPWSKEKVLDRVDLLSGMIEDGNNNPEVLQELESWIPFCVQHKLLSAKKAQKLYRNLK